MAMHIVAIAWLYVTALVALNESTIVAGVISFLFYGLLPCALLLWLGGSKARRRRQLLADQRPDDDNRPDAKPDQ